MRTERGERHFVARDMATRASSSLTCSTSSCDAARGRRCVKPIVAFRCERRRDARAHAGVDVLTTTLIVDDLVFADGSTKMAVLGGGGAQTAFGASMLSADIRVALVAGVGENDCPDECVRWLRERNVDVSGLIRTPGARTPRAWQITEADGRRTQVWRVDASEALYAMLRPRFSTWPEGVRKPRCVHFGVNPARPDVELVRDLRNAGVNLISIEPFTHATKPLSANALKELVNLADIFSPNIFEARSFFADGRLSAKDLVKAMCDAGANIVCLRMGEDGAIVYDAVANVGYSAPACARTVVDPTGCGNCFCGGFVAAYLETNDVRNALAVGSAAASIMLEHVGVPMGPLDSYRDEVGRRSAALRVDSFTL